jgi:hypothetical protein
MEFGANGSVDFVFKNEGTTPIVISNVSSTCGCTVPSWPKEPVAPGKKGAITVVYNTKIPGSFNKTVVVYSNANNSPVRMTIMGKVNPRQVEADPNTGMVKTVKDASGYPIDPNKKNQAVTLEVPLTEQVVDDNGGAGPPNKPGFAKAKAQQAGNPNVAGQTTITVEPPKSGAMLRDTQALKKAAAESKKSGK